MLRNGALLNLRLSSAQRPRVREGCVGLELAEEMLICNGSPLSTAGTQDRKAIPAVAFET